LTGAYKTPGKFWVHDQSQEKICVEGVWSLQTELCRRKAKVGWGGGGGGLLKEKTWDRGGGWKKVECPSAKFIHYGTRK